MHAVIALAVLVTAGWNVPAPDKTEHHGAKGAPACDPRSYQDEAGFQSRAKLVVDGLAPIDPVRWRQGWFRTGGDPGKYVPPVCMAKLLVNPDDQVARQYMNDDRSYTETYHFAVINWARFLPLFGDSLTPETKRKFAEAHGRGNRYFDQQGTENHKIMWLAAANVLPSYVAGNRFSGSSTEEALARAKKALREYVKALYAVGQGEWDSSTYLMFDLHGMLNIHDFAKDPETRLLAQAALDWYVAGYALKYRDGVYTAPNQRGFAGTPVANISDRTGWLWWDSHASITTNETKNFLFTMLPATSGWRPNRVLCNIARKKLPGLPVEQRNTKPNYYYGIGAKPEAGKYSETVYLAPKFTIGTLWNGHGSQMTRFMVAVETDKGAVTFTGGNPRQSDHTGKKTAVGFADGNGRYTQFAAMGPTVMSLSQCADDDTEAAYSFLRLPDGVEPKETNDWQAMTVAGVTVALYPIGGKAEVAQTEPDKKGNSIRLLKIAGKNTGFVVHVGDAGDLAKMKVGNDGFTGPDGRTLKMRFSPAEGDDAHANRLADVSIDDKPVSAGGWPIYGGPFVTQTPGILTVTDGSDTYTVDFTGDLPVYRSK
jgi:hypothetical protein